MPENEPENILKIQFRKKTRSSVLSFSALSLSLCDLCVPTRPLRSFRKPHLSRPSHPSLFQSRKPQQIRKKATSVTFFSVLFSSPPSVLSVSSVCSVLIF